MFKNLGQRNYMNWSIMNLRCKKILSTTEAKSIRIEMSGLNQYLVYLRQYTFGFMEKTSKQVVGFPRLSLFKGSQSNIRIKV